MNKLLAFGIYHRSFGFNLFSSNLGFDTFWFDDKDDVSKFDFTNSLFITEHQVDNHIPKRDDCLYFVHRIKDPEKYNILPPENVIELAVAFRDMYGKYSIKFKNLNPVPLNEKNYEFYCKNGNHYNYYTMLIKICTHFTCYC